MKPLKIPLLLLLALTLSGAAIRTTTNDWRDTAISMVPLSTPVRTNYAYVVATAYDTNGVESDYSDELTAPYTGNTLAIAWDPSPSDGIAGYNLYWGTNSGLYRWRANAGTNLEYGFVVVPQPPVTNVYRVFMQTATNSPLWFTDSPSGPIATVTNVSTSGNVPNVFWRLRIAVTNAP